MPAITVDQQKLVMNAFAATFQNNLIAADVVTWKQYDTEMDDRNGLQVAEQVGPRYAVRETVNGVADLTSGVQASVFGSEQFTVNRTFATDMGWSDFQKIRDIGSARESEVLKNAAMQLAERIDAHILGTALNVSNNWVGTSDGVAVAGHDDVARAYTRIKEEGVDDSDLRLVLSYGDREALSSTILAYPATDSLATGNFRKGFEGEINGIPTMFTQQLPALTMGTRAASGANVNVNGANQNVNYKDVARSAAPGQYMTQTLNVRVSAGGTETVRDGEVFTIAGVFAYDNRAGVSTGRLQQFRVIGNYTAAAGLINNMRIFPAIIVPGSGSGDDILVNTAHATVDAAPAGGALITFVGASGATVRTRALLKKSAVICNTAPLIMPATGEGSRMSLTKVPLSVRMWKHSDFNTGAHSVRFDVALTANVKERRHAVRLNGVA